MTETAQDIIARLNRTLTTMMNDDLSEVRTEKRTRHIERTGAVHDAADWIEAAIAREAALREALGGLGALPEGYCYCPISRDATRPDNEHTCECQAARLLLQVMS